MCRDPRRLETLEAGEEASQRREYAYLRQKEARGEGGEVKVAVVTLLRTGEGEREGQAREARKRAVSFDMGRRQEEEDDEDALIL